MSLSETSKTMRNQPEIFQIFYQSSQKNYLDPSFTPFDNTNNSCPTWCEYGVFHKEFHKGTCDKGITGFISWKFHEKTTLKGWQVYNWIESNPRHDVYSINPFPNHMRKNGWLGFKNIWDHGEKHHPGLLALAQNLFDKADYKIDLGALRMSRQKITFCNYWFGTPTFWKRYISFCDPLYNLIESGLNDDERAKLFAPADPSGICYIPYIFERLFSTLLCVDESIRAISMSSRPIDKQLSLTEWVLRELKRPCKTLILK